jgi:hypothetical protein
MQWHKEQWKVSGWREINGAWASEHSAFISIPAHYWSWSKGSLAAVNGSSSSTGPIMKTHDNSYFHLHTIL